MQSKSSHHKVAVLCNGPSRSAYSPDTEYAYRIGCNIPWAEVDCTVITDEQLITAINKDRSILKYPIYISEEALDVARRYKINDLDILGQVDRHKYASSGHVAVQLAIDLGYKDIDIYGADAQFTNDIRGNIHSYTREFVKDVYSNGSGTWKLQWDQMVDNFKDVKFNFIRKQVC